jgi:hypothetical protein
MKTSLCEPGASAAKASTAPTTQARTMGELRPVCIDAQRCGVLRCRDDESDTDHHGLNKRGRPRAGLWMKGGVELCRGQQRGADPRHDWGTYTLRLWSTAAKSRRRRIIGP